MKGFRHINYRGRHWDIVEQPWDKDPGFPMSDVEYLAAMYQDSKDILMSMIIDAPYSLALLKMSISIVNFKACDMNTMNPCSVCAIFHSKVIVVNASCDKCARRFIFSLHANFLPTDFYAENESDYETKNPCIRRFRGM